MQVSQTLETVHLDQDQHKHHWLTIGFEVNFMIINMQNMTTD